MDMEGLRADYGAVEWKIENFSCWNDEIHHEKITSLIFFGELHFEICPREEFGGLMSVRMLGDPCIGVPGDLSLIDSDGYVFCSEEVEIDSEMRDAFKLSSTPMFENLVSRSKMNEGLYKDQVSLRFQRKDAVSDSVLYMRTVICVHEFSIRIPREAMFNIYLHKLQNQCIRTIEYPSGDGATAKVYLYAGFSYDHREGMDFCIKGTGSRKIAFIRSRIFLFDKDGKAVIGDARDFLYDSDNSFCTVSQIPTRTEAIKKRILWTLWRLRIVPENRSELLCTYITTDQGRKLSTGSLCLPTSNTWVEKPSENIIADTSCQPENSMEVLTKDFMSLYQDRKYSDITLKCDNVTFAVHRAILSARSPVLNRMLSSDMMEAASGEVDIGDLDPSTLGLFLTYLYTGAVEDLQDDSALKLYYAADKYQVPSLKRECADFLSSSVSFKRVQCSVPRGQTQ